MATTVVAGIFMGLFFQQCAFVGHDAGHCSITHNRKTDAFIGTVMGPILTGMLCCVMSWYVMLCHVMSCYVIMLCYDKIRMLCHVMLCYAML
jgi:hypothetical protein